MLPRLAPCAPIPILTYHQIAPAPARGTPYRSLCVAPQVFARQMRLLAALGWRGLSMGQLQPYLSGQCQGRVFGLTFDDGYANNLSNAAPVLARLGFGATCYAVSARLGQCNDWDAEKGVPQVPLMRADQLRQWLALGLEVGAHSRTHAHLSACSDAALRDEVQGGKAELEDALGQPVAHFCYPYGDQDARVRALVAQVGFVSATTTARARVQPGADRWGLPRVPVLRTTAWPTLLLKLYTAYEERHGR